MFLYKGNPVFLDVCKKKKAEARDSCQRGNLTPHQVLVCAFA